ncbi:DUF5994 family protein [Actinopolymorpha alba]|uniref:DUF5994 family protein n=1 Tax=Actinopolymorpha alba TaxID=533267 RepID=UPI00037C6725|nr:DUF5994 family protein [Actinopolymorpha alba]
MTRAPAPLAPRLRWGPSLSRSAVLHGAWWPRSTDPIEELPGLILAIDDRRGGPVTCIMLGLSGWDARPPRLRVAGRLIRLGWFTTQPSNLLTASWDNRYNIELLVVPSATNVPLAEAAMALAADAANTVPAPDILTTAAGQAAQAEMAAEDPSAISQEMIRPLSR